MYLELEMNLRLHKKKKPIKDQWLQKHYNPMTS